MSNTGKIVLTLLGLTVVGVGIYYVTKPKDGQPLLPGATPSPTGSTMPVSSQASPWEGKLVYDGSAKTYLIQNGTKRWIPDWTTYQAMIKSGYPERTKITTAQLNSIPLGITI